MPLKYRLGSDRNSSVKCFSSNKLFFARKPRIESNVASLLK